MTTGRGVAVIFADGSIYSARTFRDLERQLREDAWNPADKADFRTEMAWRAWQWSRTEVDTEASARRFFAQLETAGMLRIVRSDEKGAGA